MTGGHYQHREQQWKGQGMLSEAQLRYNADSMAQSQLPRPLNATQPMPTPIHQIITECLSHRFMGKDIVSILV